jgi:hypothetical protein
MVNFPVFKSLLQQKIVELDPSFFLIITPLGLDLPKGRDARDWILIDGFLLKMGTKTNILTNGSKRQIIEFF